MADVGGDGVTTRVIESGALVEIVIDVPKGNVLTGAVMRALDAALAAHANDNDAKLVAIRGAGKHFSFGASVEEHRRDEVDAMLKTFHAFIRRLGSYPIPTAAVVDGKCLGGAFEVALACNFVLASGTAAFACPEIKLGVLPPVLVALGPARLGAAWTDKLVLTGAEVSASALQSCGFVTDVAPEGASLEAWSAEWFRKHVAPLSAFALRQGVMTSRASSDAARRLDEVLAKTERAYLENIVGSHDGNEGIEAFVAKRAPVWRNR